MSLCRGPSVAAAATRHYRSNSSTSLRVVDIAAEHQAVIANIRKKLEERGVALPPAHFANTDVELTRYAITVGLLAAHTAADRCRFPPFCAQASCLKQRLQFGRGAASAGRWLFAWARPGFMD